MSDVKPNFDTEALMAAQEGLAPWVAMYTGARQQLIDAGWSAEGAEQMVIEMWRKP